MKVLKIIEKVVFSVAVVLGAIAIAFSFFLDEGAAEPMVGALTIGTPYYTFLGGAGALIVLISGGLLRFSDKDVARRCGEAFVVATFGIMLGLGLYGLSLEDGVGITVLLSLVASFIYVVDAILRGIILIVKAVKPTAEEGKKADEEEQIRQVLRWKELQNKGIITAEEFEEKRQAIFGLKKEQEQEPIVLEKK